MRCVKGTDHTSDGLMRRIRACSSRVVYINEWDIHVNEWDMAQDIRVITDIWCCLVVKREHQLYDVVKRICVLSLLCLVTYGVDVIQLVHVMQLMHWCMSLRPLQSATHHLICVTTTRPLCDAAANGYARLYTATRGSTLPHKYVCSRPKSYVFRHCLMWNVWSMLQRTAACCSVLRSAAVCCSVLWYVAVCCGVLQCVAALQHNVS